MYEKFTYQKMKADLPWTVNNKVAETHTRQTKKNISNLKILLNK